MSFNKDNAGSLVDVEGVLAAALRLLIHIPLRALLSQAWVPADSASLVEAVDRLVDLNLHFDRKGELDLKCSRSD